MRREPKVIKGKWKVIVLFTFLFLLSPALQAQKLIQYAAGMGSRDPDDGNIWILYEGVTARHEGMTLRSDSAHYNTKENSFTAFGNIVIQISDTTFIYGNRLFYDGNARIVDIWDDTVLLVDGRTQLRADHITYDRNIETAFYPRWGHAVSGQRRLDSRQGQYNSIRKEFYIYSDVQLSDPWMRLLTDTLVYNTVTEIAHFESATRIYTDSAFIYSELGDYNTSSGEATSFQSSHVDNHGRTIDCDTLYYHDTLRYGRARGHVRIFDKENDVTCTGRYGESDQNGGFSFVTDSALVVFVDKGDSLYLHADTVYMTTDSLNHIQSVRANYRVKVYRKDAQAMCDSAFYLATDSLLSLYRNPVLWYEHYQCQADTIELRHDTSGVRQAWLRSACFAIQQVDRDKFNQLKCKQSIVYFDKGEPLFADMLGNAQMVFYITEDDSNSHSALVGVNVGTGTDMRIYFDTARAPKRVVTYDKPDMKTYPVMLLPDEWKRMQGFQWLTRQRPRRPKDVFVW